MGHKVGAAACSEMGSAESLVSVALAVLNCSYLPETEGVTLVVESRSWHVGTC